MVLPLLYGLGARDFVDQIGYVIETCPACRTTGPFALYQSRRMVTLFMVPTVSVREQQVLECRTCGAKFGVPADRREEFAARLLSPEDLAAAIRDAAPGPRQVGAPGRIALNGRTAGPTHYQTLQVDPAADPDVIEAAFRRLALKYHPDRSTTPDAADRMRELLDAKAILADPAKRRAYDASLGLAPRPVPPAPTPPAPPTPPAKPRPDAMRADDV